MKRLAIILGLVLLCGISVAIQPGIRVIVGQQPQKPTEKTYVLNPEASQAWQQLDAAEAKLREQYQQLETQKVALMIGAGIPASERDRVPKVTAAGVEFPPKVQPSPKP